MLCIPSYCLADTCYSATLIGIPAGTHSANDSVDISNLFDTTNIVFESRSTGWSGEMFCTLGASLDNVYYYTPMSAGNDYYVHYVDEANDIDQWVKFTVTLDETSRTVSGIAGIHSSEDYTISYSYSAELIDQEPAVDEEFKQTVTSGSYRLATVAMTGIPNSVGSTDSEREESLRQAWLNNAWDGSEWIDVQYLTVTFSPPATTCNIQDQNITLPEMSLADLREKQSGEEVEFTLPLTCENTLNGKTSRNIDTWLFSNDVIDGSPYIIRNSTSTSTGVGIVLKDYKGNTISFSTVPSSGSEATPIYSAKTDDILDSTIDLYAEYYLYDTTNLSAGTVVATATVYMGYD